MPAKVINSAVLAVFALVMLVSHTSAQDMVPVVNGGAGPCSVEFIALDGDVKPVYGAVITVHVEYGFLGLKELDLQVATNADGVAQFSGLPEDTDGAYFFEAFTESLKGVAVYNPDHECRGRHNIYMAQRKPGIHESASKDQLSFIRN